MTVWGATSFSSSTRSCIALGAALALVGCGAGATKMTATQTATSSVTPGEGGTVSLPDNSAHLDIPAGALTSTTMITVTTTDAMPPSGITASSPILKFEPDGLVFTKPVTVTFTFTNATRPIVYWSNSSGGYDPIAGTVSGSTISAQVMHFSSGFVADAPLAAGAANCGEGVACVAGAMCGYGASPSSRTVSGDGTTTGNSSPSGSGVPNSGGGTSAPATFDAGAARTTSALCAGTSGGSSVPTSGGPGSTSTSDPGGGGNPSASVDASAPQSDSSMCVSTGPSAPSTVSASMCCSCGSDGKFHCAACSGSSGGTNATHDGGVSAGDAGAPTCAAGAACAPGQACGGGDSSGAKLCCTCGVDGHFQCDATCSGQTSFDGGPSSGGDQCTPGGACVVGGGRCGNASPSSCLMCDCSVDGKYVCTACTGTPPPPTDSGVQPGGGVCVDGSACTPGAGCKGASPTGQCLACMCSAGGTLQCNPCGGQILDGGAPPPPPPADGGSTAPPATCDPGLACPPGYQCKNMTPAGGCTMCTCGADGYLACGACPGAPPTGDAGAPPPSIPPQSCIQGGACPQAGLGCSNGLPSGNGCLKCACGQNLQLMCAGC